MKEWLEEVLEPYRTLSINQHRLNSDACSLPTRTKTSWMSVSPFHPTLAEAAESASRLLPLDTCSTASR